MTDRRPKRPRDPNELARRIVDIATGDEQEAGNVQVGHIDPITLSFGAAKR